MIYCRESTFTNVNKQTLNTNLVHNGDRAPVKTSYLKYVTRIIEAGAMYWGHKTAKYD